MDLKAMREAAGLSVIEVAKKFNVSRNAVYGWEYGHAFPNRKRLIELSKLYGCTVDALLEAAEEAKSKRKDDKQCLPYLKTDIL